jgi:hypothetical protein
VVQETKTLGVKEEPPSSLQPISKVTLGVKEEPASSLQPISKVFASAGSDTNTSAVTEDEIRRLLIAIAPVALQDFASRFKPRLKTPEVKHTLGFAIRFALIYCALNNYNSFCFSY